MKPGSLPLHHLRRRRGLPAGFARPLALLAALAALGPGPVRAQAPPSPDEIPDLDAWVVVPGFGELRIRFDRAGAPNHVSHFLALAGSGFYDGLSFHRIVPRLLVQAGAEATREGDPRQWEILPPDYRVAAEIPGPDGDEATAAAADGPEPAKRRIGRGTVCMALQDGEPGTAGTEWFVVLRDEVDLAGLGVPIGEVVEGAVTLDRLEQASTWVNRRPLQRIGFDVILGPSDRPEGAGAPSEGDDRPPDSD